MNNQYAKGDAPVRAAEHSCSKARLLTISLLAALAAEHLVVALLHCFDGGLELLLVDAHHDEHAEVLRVHVRISEHALR